MIEIIELCDFQHEREIPVERSSDQRERDSAIDRRRFLAGAGSASAALLAAAYVPGKASAGTRLKPFRSARQPVRGGTLTMAQLEDAANSVDPNQVIWAETRSYCRAIADSLTDQDPATGEIVPWLAQSWTVNKHATSFRFKLRRGVTFSDGSKLNAAAVKTAYDGIIALGPLAQLASTFLSGYKNAKVISPYEVEINFEEPNSQFLQASTETALAILSPNSYTLTPTERDAGQFHASGLFTVESYTPGQQLTLVRRKGYAWPSSIVQNQGEAYLDSIVASWQPLDNIRLGNLTSGQLDVDWPHVPMNKADQAAVASAGDTIYAKEIPGVGDTLLPNTSAGKVFSDLRVRQAFQKAIDRAAYASTIFWDTYPVTAGVLDRGTPGWSDQSALLKYDLAGAKKLLEAAGWTVGAGGYRQKNGQTLTVNYLATVPGPGVELIQAQVKLAGFDVQIQSSTPAEDQADEHDGNYDIVELSLDRADPHAMAAWFDTSLVDAAPDSLTQTAPEAKVVSAYFKKGLATTDESERFAVYTELQQYMIEQGIAFPVYDRREIVGVSKNVHGFAFNIESLLVANDIWKS
jgi:peptide/nickel transport system substrate-binding protein